MEQMGLGQFGSPVVRTPRVCFFGIRQKSSISHLLHAPLRRFAPRTARNTGSSVAPSYGSWPGEQGALGRAMVTAWWPAAEAVFWGDVRPGSMRRRPLLRIGRGKVEKGRIHADLLRPEMSLEAIFNSPYVGSSLAPFGCRPEPRTFRSPLITVIGVRFWYQMRHMF